MKAVLRNTQTGELIPDALGKTIREYPRWDMGPVSDPQPGQEWLLVVSNERPTEAIPEWPVWTQSGSVGGPHIEYTHLNTWVLDWSVEAGEPDEYAVWQQHLDAGYEDQVSGIKLKTTVEAQEYFAHMVTLLTLAMSAGAIDSNTVQAIWDYDGVSHNLTTGDTLALLLRYGIFCQQLFNLYKP